MTDHHRSRQRGLRLGRLVRALLASIAVLAATLTLTAPTPAGAAPSAGWNDWGCRPSTAHPDPVVLLHGLGSNGATHWTAIAPALVAKGYCVYSLTHGQVSPLLPVGGLVSVDNSAAEITRFIDRVRTSTGARQVDLVGHSEGGFLSLYVPKTAGGASRVHRVVSLAPPTHGTTFANLTVLGDQLGLTPTAKAAISLFGCKACLDLAYNGGPVQRMVSGPIAQPGVAYTIIASRADALVTPHETSFVREPGVTNAFVQDHCPINTVGHIAMAYDLTVIAMITNALDPATARPVPCVPGLPV